MKMHSATPWILLFCVTLLFGCGDRKAARDPLMESPRKKIRLDPGWRFHHGRLENAYRAGYDDKPWRKVDLPHDWSIEDLQMEPSDSSNERIISGPFDSESPGGRATGYTRGGTGWYRKHFHLPESYQDKRIVVRFGGVYMNADVWINGVHLGHHPYGYTSFHYDLTPHLNFGDQENVLAVEVKNHGKNSRWYSGSGIYRHVDLLITHATHIAHWGTFVTTPEVSGDEAHIKVENELHVEQDTFQDIRAERELRVEKSIVDPQGNRVAFIAFPMSVYENTRPVSSDVLKVDHPQLWSPEAPALYKAVTVLKEKGTVIDRAETTFGIRTFRFTPEEGFVLNGKPALLKGACMHHDNGPLGAAAHDRAEQRRVEIMKANGFNAIRCAHNPPSVAFLDACDSLGMLVIDEAFDCWNQGKKPEDYHLYFEDWWKKDLRSMVLRDRNHPSVIMWSTGNEIPNRESPTGVQYAEKLANFIRDLDPTRPVTNGVNGVNPQKDPFMAPLDVVGYNYAMKWNEGHQYPKNAYVNDHKRKPNRVIYGSESFPLTAFDYWMAARDHSWVVGDFVWTGYDYLGEAGIGWYGFTGEHFWTVAYCGDINLIGDKRPQSHYRDVLWSDQPEISAFVHNPEHTFGIQPGWDWRWRDVWPSWTWPEMEGREMDVEVYSNCEKVTLMLNGREIGTKPVSRKTRYTARFKVPYQPGTLKAIGYRNGQMADEWELATAGAAAKIELHPERKKIQANGSDLCYVDVEITDTKGNRVPHFNDLVQFEVKGPAKLIAVASAKPNSTESFQQSQRHAFRGRCQAILQSTGQNGKVIISAQSGQIKDQQTEIVFN